MPTSLPLPPSARDFLAYSRIVIDAASTRTVADELKISQTRVRQIVKRVLDWLHQTLPAHSEAGDAARLNLAQHIAADRLQNIYGIASRSWQQTGETKYANLALKVLLAQTKLPALPGTLEALAADATDVDALENVVLSRREGQEAEDALHSEQPLTTETAPNPASFSIHTSASPSSPPPGDCSPTPQSVTSNANSITPAPTPTPNQQTLSAAPPKFQSAVRRAFLDPAHHPLATGDSAAVAELKITSQSSSFTINKPLNRSERRRLRRLATRSAG